MEQNNEIKNKFIEEFCNLGGNYKKLDTVKALKNKINRHLQDIGS